MPRLMSILGMLAIGPLLLVHDGVPQSQPRDVLRFEVASIKRHTSGSQGSATNSLPGGRYEAINTSVRRLILFAHSGEAAEIIGAPDWTSSERYDVLASAGFDASLADLRVMVRSLLTDRFGFLSHVETRERPAYALVLAGRDGQLGPDIRRIEVDCNAVAAAAKLRQEATPPASNGAPLCGMVGSGGMLRSGGLTMQALASMLRAPSGRIVLDATGLEGSYEFTLRYDPNLAAAADRAPSDAPSIFVALEEQLGLRLESTTSPVQVLVVDRIERPTAN